jgi:hypothetical protein
MRPSSKLNDVLDSSPIFWGILTGACVFGVCLLFLAMAIEAGMLTCAP